jgi:hypothetical protein
MFLFENIHKAIFYLQRQIAIFNDLERKIGHFFNYLERKIGHFLIIWKGTLDNFLEIYLFLQYLMVNFFGIVCIVSFKF